jgi:hypothetical protein
MSKKLKSTILALAIAAVAAPVAQADVYRHPGDVYRHPHDATVRPGDVYVHPGDVYVRPGDVYRTHRAGLPWGDLVYLGY